jgi:uncharacterized protein (DUF433 family)
MTTADIVRDFPELTEDHVRAAVEFAAVGSADSPRRREAAV